MTQKKAVPATLDALHPQEGSEGEVVLDASAIFASSLLRFQVSDTRTMVAVRLPEGDPEIVEQKAISMRTGAHREKLLTRYIVSGATLGAVFFLVFYGLFVFSEFSEEDGMWAAIFGSIPGSLFTALLGAGLGAAISEMIHDHIDSEIRESGVKTERPIELEGMQVPQNVADAWHRILTVSEAYEDDPSCPEQIVLFRTYGWEVVKEVAETVAVGRAGRAGTPDAVSLQADTYDILRRRAECNEFEVASPARTLMAEVDLSDVLKMIES